MDESFYVWIAILGIIMITLAAAGSVKRGEFLRYIMVYPFVKAIYLGNRYRCRFPEYQSGQPHHAIILAYTHRLSKIRPSGGGIDVLIKHFRANDIPYRVYECNDSQRFIDIVRDTNVRALHIFGHGRRHAICLGKKNELVYYCDLQSAPEKDYVAQWHCNHKGGKSLEDYIAVRKGFVSDSMRYLFQNRREIKERISEFTLTSGYQAP